MTAKVECLEVDLLLVTSLEIDQSCTKRSTRVNSTFTEHGGNRFTASSTLAKYFSE